METSFLFPLVNNILMQGTLLLPCHRESMTAFLEPKHPLQMSSLPLRCHKFLLCAKKKDKQLLNISLLITLLISVFLVALINGTSCMQLAKPF